MSACAAPHTGHANSADHIDSADSSTAPSYRPASNSAKSHKNIASVMPAGAAKRRGADSAPLHRVSRTVVLKKAAAAARPGCFRMARSSAALQPSSRMWRVQHRSGASKTGRARSRSSTLPAPAPRRTPPARSATQPAAASATVRARCRRHAVRRQSAAASALVLARRTCAASSSCSSSTPGRGSFVQNLVDLVCKPPLES